MNLLTHLISLTWQSVKLRVVISFLGLIFELYTFNLAFVPNNLSFFAVSNFLMPLLTARGEASREYLLMGLESFTEGFCLIFTISAYEWVEDFLHVFFQSFDSHCWNLWMCTFLT